MSRAWRRKVVFVAGIGTGVVGLASPAWAHLDPRPAAVQAGRTVVVAFSAEHGCGDSPTVRLDIKLPVGLDAAPVPKTGWKTSVAKGVVTFAGGRIAAHTPGTFSLRFTAPAKAGTSLVFPSVQYCVKGEKDWLQQTIKGQPEPDFPAPVVDVVAGRAPTTTMRKTK